MSETWLPLETTTHQDHVIAHIIGATVLGWVVAGEAAHLLLDIGFLWTVYLDTEMNLLPQGVAIAELDDLSSAEKAELAFDAQQLLSEGREAQGLKRFTATPCECLVTAVDLFAADSKQLIVVRGEEGAINIETSLVNSQVKVYT